MTETVVKNQEKVANNIFPDSEKFFTDEETRFFLANYENMILYMENGMPFVNYNLAKRVFENVVGNNYSLEILSYEFIKEYDTFMVHLRVTMSRRGKTIFKDVVGTASCKRKKDTKEISNFENLSKSATKDAFKKFLSDYIGIGSIAYAMEKKLYEDKFKNKSKSSNYNYQNNSNEQFKCSECSAQIDSKVHYYSTTLHPAKRPLCQSCQSKLR